MPTKHVVVKATPRKDVTGLNMGSGDMLFGEKTNAFQVSDHKLAAEIEAEHDGDVVVIESHAPAERGHTYFFGQMPEMPWKKGKDKPDESRNQTH